MAEAESTCKRSERAHSRRDLEAESTRRARRDLPRSRAVRLGVALLSALAVAAFTTAPRQTANSQSSRQSIQAGTAAGRAASDQTKAAGAGRSGAGSGGSAPVRSVPASATPASAAPGSAAPGYSQTSPAQVDTSRPDLTQQLKVRPGTLPANVSQAHVLAGEIGVLKQLHAVNQMEIQAGQLAEKNGSTSRIRTFGKRLVMDHRFADRLLQQYLDYRHLSLNSAVASPLLMGSNPASQAQLAAGAQPLSAAVQGMLAQTQHSLANLEGLKGKLFDQGFLAVMRQGHLQSMGALREVQSQVTPRLRGLLGRLMPVLQEHEELAQKLK